MMPPAKLKPHPALPTPPNRPSSIDHRPSTYNPNAKPILALRMPDGSNLIVAGRTRHQIALADPTCKAVKTTLIDYDPTIHTDDWVQMTNAGEHIINRTATTEHYRTYFTHNPITHAQAIEQGLVPIDPRTGRPTAAYTKGRQLAEQDLQAKAEAAAAAAKAAAAEAKTKAEKQLPGQTKWSTPSPKSQPLSDSETKQTLISVAAHGLSKSKNDRFQFTHTLTQRKKGTEYTVATDGRRITIISQPTYKPDTDDTTQEWHSNKGEKSKENQQAPKWTQVIPARFRGETTINLSYYSFLGKGLKDPAKNKHIDSPLLNNNQYIVVNSTNGFLSLNPIYVRDAYKQIVDLGKKLGFSPIVKLQYNDKASPVMFTAEHNGIKWQHLLMPVHRTEEVTPGDIILGEQPTIYGQQDTGSFSLRAKPIKLEKIATDRQEAKAILKERGVFNKPLTYKKGEDEYKTTLSGNGFRKLTDSHVTKSKLVPLGYTVQEAQTIHMTAVSYIDLLFENAYDVDIQQPYHGRGRKSIPHLLCNFNVPGFEKNFTANISLLQFTDEKTGDKLYALHVEILSPGELRVPMEEKSFINGRSTGADGIVSSNIEKVNNNLLSPSQQETLVSSLSLRRRPDRNINSLLNERETTLARVSNYIKREADRTANIMGNDTELQRAGVHFAQANAIINALDTYIFSKELIRKNTAEYRRLRDLRHFINEYITVARKGKLPVRRNTKDGHITIKAATTSYREAWERLPI